VCDSKGRLARGSFQRRGSAVGCCHGSGWEMRRVRAVWREKVRREMCVREKVRREMCVREMCVREMCVREKVRETRRHAPVRACVCVRARARVCVRAFAFACSCVRACVRARACLCAASSRRARSRPASASTPRAPLSSSPKSRPPARPPPWRITCPRVRPSARSRSPCRRGEAAVSRGRRPSLRRRLPRRTP
jgi:hypothetical protein